jgi:hypothetical protein
VYFAVVIVVVFIVKSSAYLCAQILSKKYRLITEGCNVEQQQQKNAVA